ncbi:MAG: O-antigen ligase family protein [Candidatus Staskawiczbacteria bacterium]|nr:O-antigen ligase family protein [Candidatus Staskawiczbacteria bacterium]
MSSKTLQTICRTFLFAIIAVVPFIYVGHLYFPYVSGKIYLFRALVAVAFFFWMWLLLKDKNYLPNSKNILVVAITLFFLALIVAAFFGVDPAFSFFGSIERSEGVLQYGFWLAFFLMLVSVFNTERDWKLLFSVFIIIVVLLSTLAWLTRVLSPEGWLVTNHPQLLQYQGQLFGVAGNPAYFAGLLLFAIGFSFMAIERRFFASRLLQYLLFAAIGFFIVTLIFTEIRGGYLGLLAGVFLFSILMLFFLRRTHKRLAYSLGAIVLLGLISLGILFSAKNTEFVKDNHILSRITEVADFWGSASIRERVLNWNIALKAFKERPVFGYGPENYGAAFNKYYDFRVGVSEPWFDRAHSQPLDTLATGGILLFSFYVFWLASAIFLIFRISKKKRILSFLLASIFLAYFVQGLFLFDVPEVYFGLFLFLAYLVYEDQRNHEGVASRSYRAGNFQFPISKFQIPILIVTAVFSAFVIYATALMPYKANAAVFQFYRFSENGLYERAEPFLKEAFSIKSPYTYWEVRKRAGWQFSTILEYEVSEKTPLEQVEVIKEMYPFITSELERFIEARPTDPQMYYVLGRVYRLGYEKLKVDDLGKAETVFQKAVKLSDLRVDYFNEYAKVLVLQNKFEEGEKLVKDYVARVDFYDYFPFVTLGHFYFVAGKYDLAFEEYKKARALDYPFFEVEPEYARYLFVAENQKDYQAIVDIAKLFLARWGPDADTYFNIAVGYMNLEKKEEAREYFLKAVELKPEGYEEYRQFFE